MFCEIFLSKMMCGVREASAQSAICTVIKEEWENF